MAQVIIPPNCKQCFNDLTHEEQERFCKQTELDNKYRHYAHQAAIYQMQGRIVEQLRATEQRDRYLTELLTKYVNKLAAEDEKNGVFVNLTPKQQVMLKLLINKEKILIDILNENHALLNTQLREAKLASPKYETLRQKAKDLAISYNEIYGKMMNRYGEEICDHFDETTNRISNYITKELESVCVELMRADSGQQQ